jgi:hypothetical protein
MVLPPFLLVDKSSTRVLLVEGVLSVTQESSSSPIGRGLQFQDDFQFDVVMTKAPFGYQRPK